MRGTSVSSMRLVIPLALLCAACGRRATFGTVESGKITVEGRVDAEYLARQLEQLDPWFEACYARTLRRVRNTEGVITLRLHGSEGTLRPEVAENGTGDTELADCVTNAFSKVTLEESPSSEPWNFTAEWPVTFSTVRRD